MWHQNILFFPSIVFALHFCGRVNGARSNVEPGKHCVDIPNFTGSGTVETCASCFFQQNCLGTNICLTGSEGDMCERCVHYSDLGQNGHKTHGYYRVGNACVSCLTFPWALVALGIFIAISFFIVAYNGLTPSVATKIKQGLDFLQYVILCFSIKVAWSNTISTTVLLFTFSYFSSSVATPACLVPQSQLLYFMEWGVSVALVAIFLILMCVLDLRNKSQLRKCGIPVPVQKTLWRKRSVFRRFAYLVLMIFYVPVATSAIQSFTCTDGLYPDSLTLYAGKALFLYDMRINCDEVGFSAMNSISTLVMLAHTCLLPLLVLFFTLRQRKWGFLQSQMIQYGSVYEAYKERWCFWETLVMLRKLVYILLTNTYPVSPKYQAIGHMCVTGIFLLATLIFQPFRKFTWNLQILRKISPSVLFEVLSNVCLILLEMQGLLIAYDLTVPILDMAFILLLAVALVCWLTIVLAVDYERTLPELDDLEVPLVEKKSLLVVESDAVYSQRNAADEQTTEEIRLLGFRERDKGSGKHPEATASRSKGRKPHGSSDLDSKTIDFTHRMKGHERRLGGSDEKVAEDSRPQIYLNRQDSEITKLHKRPWNANDPEKNTEKRRQSVIEVKAFEKTLEHQKKRAAETKAQGTRLAKREDNKERYVESVDELISVLDVDGDKASDTSSHLPVSGDPETNIKKNETDRKTNPPEQVFEDSSNTSLF